MSSLLQFFIWIPLIGLLTSLLIPRKKERILSSVALITIGFHAIGVLIFAGFWVLDGGPVLNIKHLTVFKSGSIEIFINFYFDKVTAVFAIIGSLLSFLVTVFSKYYMHREAGFKRYFVLILFFFFSYTIIVFSGNFETLFAGWEILGICSYLLIAFYRDRYLPAKNSLKVISFYRLADVCIVLAMWMSHHLWHENITFFKLNDQALVESQLQNHYSLGFFIAIMIFLGAIIKSAQFPFSSWLPRAMEGPTSSSAIFYGSLSIHLGVFLLLRTYPFWQGMPIIKILIICTGILTAVIATGIARVQSTVKTQIAYSSVAQIGFIFIETALGFHMLALIHFAGNAFLRTYQLLVSPSILSYLTHDQFYNFSPSKKPGKRWINKKISYSFYMLCVQEWHLDFILYRFFWHPFKWIGNKLEVLTSKVSVVILTALFSIGLYGYFASAQTPFYELLPLVLGFFALLLIIKAFTERGNAKRAWALMFFSQFFIALSFALNKYVEFSQILIYLSGGTIAGIIGFICLHKLSVAEGPIDLNRFHGHAYEHPVLALVFLLSCLGLAAFPITPSFIGFDILLTHIETDQVPLIIFAALCFLFTELSILRIFARIFTGQHKKTYHAMAFRSS